MLGRGVLPPAAFAESNLQQSVGRLHVSNLITANQVLTELRYLSHILISRSPTALETPVYLSFTDASQGSGSYSRTGYVSGRFLSAGWERVYHVLDWVSTRWKRVAFSSMGIEILAEATSSDRGSLVADSLQSLHQSTKKLPFVLSVDSNGLYSTITTLHEGMDYRLRPNVARLRDSFENGEISTMQWLR